MNERIRELAKQAGGHKCLCIDSITLSLLGENSIEKFAELIVRDCIVDFYRRHLDINIDVDITIQVERYVKEYFGVKE